MFKDKEKEKEYLKNWHLENKKRRTLEAKQNYLKNRETILKCRTAYGKANKEKILEYQSEYRLQNKKKRSNYQKNTKYKKKKQQYAVEHRPAILEYQKQYRVIKKEQISKQRKAHYLENKEKLCEDRRKYYIENKDKINKQGTVYMRRKRKESIEFRIKCNLSSRVRDVLKRNLKSISAMKLLGCTISEFKTHLQKQFQPGMTFENYGEWHIDHKTPCAIFDLIKPGEQKVCFNYMNLQPLWAIDNLRKGAR